MSLWKARSQDQAPKPPCPQEAQNPEGVDIIYNGECSTVDVIAVHGLNGHRERTWSTASGINWLRDHLPRDIPNTRILAYGYNANTHGTSQLTIKSVYEHGITLAQTLCTYRRNTKTESRPIIFLAHSLGGIIVKAALIQAHIERTTLQSIKACTYGIAFFGTPHAGSSIAQFATLLLKAGSIFMRTNTVVIHQLKANSEILQTLFQQFNPISSDFELAFFYETYKTAILLRRGILIVPRHSATLSGNARGHCIPLAKSHTELVRFNSPLDQDYLTVAQIIRRLVINADHVLETHWKMQDSSTHGSPTGVVHAPSTSSSMKLPYTLPVQQNPGFVGRVVELAKLHDHLCPDTKVSSEVDSPRQSKVAILHGLGGIGKTQLSLAYAQRYEKAFDAVIWLDCSTERTTLLSFRDTAQRLINARRNDSRDGWKDLLGSLAIGEYVSASGQVSADKAALPQIASSVVKFLESGTMLRNWLIIMDNLDNIDNYPVVEFIPQSQHGRVIITTRATAIAHLGLHLEVDQIDEDSGVQILLSAACLRIESSTDREDAKAIANKLGLLPLALEQAGAYVSKARIRLKRYLDLFEKYHLQLLDESKQLGGQASVIATWELSFRRLETEDASAAQLLTLLAFLHNSTFWEGLMVTPFTGSCRHISPDSSSEYSSIVKLWKNELWLTNALAKLLSVSLVKRNTSNGNIYVHPLMHYWNRERLDPGTRRKKLIEAILVIGQALNAAYSQPRNKETRAYIARIVPHADHCYSLVSEEGTNTIFAIIMTDRLLVQALFCIGILLQDMSRLEEAGAIFSAITGADAGVCPPEMIANAQRRLGHNLILFSKYKESEVILLQSTATLTDHLGKYHQDTLAAQLELGMTYHRSFQFSQAECTLREITEHDRNETSGLLGRTGREATSILALVYTHQGRLKDALELLSPILNQPLEDDDDPVHHLTIKYRHALILQSLGQWSIAMLAYQEVHDGLEAILGPMHPLTLRTANALGRLYCFFGRYRESRDMLDLAWKGQESLGFSKESETAQLRTLFNIGVLNREEGLYNEAFECLNRALRAEQSCHGSHAFSTLQCKLELAILQAVTGKAVDAVAGLQSVLEVQLKHYPDSTMEHTRTRTALSEALIRLGLLDQAGEVLSPALEYSQTSLDPDNPVRLKVELAKAGWSVACGREDYSILDTITHMETTFGPNHASTIYGKELLMRIYEQLKLMKGDSYH